MQTKDYKWRGKNPWKFKSIFLPNQEAALMELFGDDMNRLQSPGELSPSLEYFVTSIYTELTSSCSK